MKNPGFLRSFRTPLLLAFLTFSIFSCSLDMDGAFKSDDDYVTICFGQSALVSERYVAIPDFSSLTDIASYNIQKIRVYVDDILLDTFTVNSGVESIQICVTKANHSFYLEGLNSTNQVILKSDKINRDVTPNININLPLKPYSTVEEGETPVPGSIKIILKFPAATAEISEYYVKCDADSIDSEETGDSGLLVSLTSEPLNKTFTIKNLNPGVHNVNVTICKTSSFNSNKTISIKAVVFSGLESSKVFNNSAPIDEALSFSHEQLKPPVIEDWHLCLNGSDGLFVADQELTIDGKTRKCITFDSPKRALDFIKKADGWKDESDFTIYVSGTVKAPDASEFTESSMVYVDMSSKTVNLKGYKPSSSSPNPVLDADSKGRVLYVNAGTVKIEGMTLTGANVSDSGGGIYVNLNGTVIASNTTISRNVVTTGSGGGIYVNNGKCKLTGCNIVDNKSNDCGGGIFVNAQLESETDPNCSATDCNFSDNESEDSSGITGDGGAIYVPSGSYFFLKGGTVEKNISHNNGGAVGVAGTIYFSDSETTKLYIPAGTDGKNDVYVADTGKINIKGTLNPPTEAGGIVATILPYEYSNTVQVLYETLSEASKFAVKSQSHLDWAILSTGKISPLFAKVNGTSFFDLSTSINAIKNATGEIEVVLYAGVNVDTESMMYESYSAGSYPDSIPAAIKQTSADKVRLSVAEGNIINIPDYGGLFSYCNRLTYADLRGFDTSNVTTMKEWFYYCLRLEYLNVSGFDTSKVTDMSSMFMNCQSLKELDVTKFDTSKVTKMGSIFCGLLEIETLDVTKFNTSKVTDMSSMFYGMKKIETLDVSGFDTSEVVFMNQMFYGMEKIETLDITVFKTPKISSMYKMFMGCSSLKTIYASESFTTTSVNPSIDNDAFQDCSALEGGKGTTYDPSRISSVYARIDRGPSSATPGYFTARPIGDKPEPNAVGDIVFKVGTATAYSDGLTLTDDQKKAAIAVIFYKGTGLNNGSDFTTERMLGVGLCYAPAAWCTADAKAYNVKIESILCEPDDGGSPGNYTWTKQDGSQVRNGKNNLSQIGTYLNGHGSSDDTETDGNYPAFDFVKKYKEKRIGSETESRVLGTEFEYDWYLPTLAEMYEVFRQRELVNKVINLCLNFGTINNGMNYWTSSPHGGATNPEFASYVYINSSMTIGKGSEAKTTVSNIRAIHEF